jgi:hypothetical protein
MTFGKPLPDAMCTRDNNTSIFLFSRQEKSVHNDAFPCPTFLPSSTHRVQAFFHSHPCVDSEHSPNFLPARCAAMRRHSFVSPRCLEPQEAHCSMGAAHDRMRGSLCFGPSLHVVRGASSGGRLGGRPQRHHQPTPAPT